MIFVLKLLRGWFFLIGLTLLILCANLLQMMSIVVYPFSKTAFMRWNIMMKALFGNAAVRASHACGNRITVTGDRASRENAIVIANHQSYLDIPLLWMWAFQLRTIGWIKWFVKDEFKYVPGIGWGLKLSHALFVKRNWARDENAIRKTFHTIHEADIPFWVTIFPEGTRMKPVKFTASQEYSRKKGLPIFERVLFPRPKGVWATLRGLNSKISALYDVSIGFREDPPSLVGFYCYGGYDVNLHITRFAKAELPTTEAEFNAWMFERFVQKNEWLKQNSGYVPRGAVAK